MPRNYQNVNVDGKKLKEQLRERGMGLSEASLAMGKSHSYLSTAIAQRGYLPLSTLKTLDAMFNIKAEDITLTEETEMVSEEEACEETELTALGVIGSMSMDEFTDVLANAFLKALKMWCP